MSRAHAIVPALDEAATIGGVVGDLLRRGVPVIVVDNGSRDDTARLARDAGATVVSERRRGYGAACIAGIAALPADADIVVFLDADGSDDLDSLHALLAPIRSGVADLVVASRSVVLGDAGAVTLPQRFGNALASAWLRARFALPATDLGPFRAIRRSTLASLGMADRDYGWTVEMQLRAARQRVRYAEVRVPARARRGGRSKVSGTIRGVLGASAKILGLLLYYDAIEPLLRRAEKLK